MSGEANPAVGPVRAADGLGWASGALGAPMLFVGGRMLQTIGIRPDPKPRLILAAVGLREFLALQTIVAMRHRRVGAWSRVAGDTMDLSLLGAAWRTRREDAPRLMGAMAFVLSILAADLIVALRLSRAEGVGVSDGLTSHGAGATRPPPDGPASVRTTITVLASEPALRRAFADFPWSAFDPRGLEAEGRLRFQAAPADRGTELHLNLEPPVPRGAVGATALKLVGNSPDQKINDELRRFKARVETGVEVRSDKTPAAFSSRRQIFQRPGRPRRRATHGLASGAAAAGSGSAESAAGSSQLPVAGRS
jgi:hypothetical protein